ncbi:DinB family protein [Nakamurella sp.]|uniref:DinB family protein n=1 Tax=Nakamurella sp. TaxID=1869182 RepID=UPI003B3A5B85
MTVEPDTKDWTWVIDKRCPECGFDASAIPLAALPDLLRANASAWRAVLVRPTVRARPGPGTWSPLEYGCHVRDACRIFAERLALMLAQDDPPFANWDQDATAVEQDYAAQDPDRVAADLQANAGEIADAFAAVRADQWERTGRRSNGSVFTVATLARYFAHDPVHHLHDVGG